MASSLKKNYALNLINTITGIIFPLITFPYASRVLLAEGIGIVNFYQSIISYIILITSLGIPFYATREIAKVKHDQIQLSQTTTEILYLHILLTIIGYIAVIIICFLIKNVIKDKIIFLILSSSIFFTTIGCDWFFRGTENFKFITIRGLIVRIIYIPLLFIFVKSSNDLIIYSILTVMVSVGNNAFNFYKLTKETKLNDLSKAAKHPFKHLKGIVKIFALTASISLYVQLNILILGFISSSTNVGYYVAASRVTAVIAGLIVALQTSLLPRSSSLISQDNNLQLNKTLSKVMNFIYFFGCPLSLGLIIMAPIIIQLFAGESYLEAIPTLRILSIAILPSLLNAFICSGILVPKAEEKKATIACLIGGGTSIIFNFTFIPFFAQNGAAAASLLTELTVGIAMIILGYNVIPIKLWQKSYLNYVIGAILMFIICYICWNLCNYEAYRLIVIPIIGFLSYFSYLYLLKDKFLTDIKDILNIKLRKK